MPKEWQKLDVKMFKYFKAHPRVNALAHLLIGVGIGILVTYPMVGVHPLRWGMGVLGVGLLVHLYPLLQ